MLIVREEKYVRRMNSDSYLFARFIQIYAFIPAFAVILPIFQYLLFFRDACTTLANWHTDKVMQSATRTGLESY